MPRRSAAEARTTIRRIVQAGVDKASVEGLYGLTIGNLADELGMSKAGVIGPFGSKDGLQAAVLDAAIERFVHAVVAPGAGQPAGRAALDQLLERWVNYLAAGPFPNGCFITAASCELDGRDGPLRERLREIVVAWRAVLHEQVLAAQRERSAAQRPADEIVLALTGLAMAANQAIQLLGSDPAAVADQTLRAMGAVLA